MGEKSFSWNFICLSYSCFLFSLPKLTITNLSFFQIFVRVFKVNRRCVKGLQPIEKFNFSIFLVIVYERRNKKEKKKK